MATSRNGSPVPFSMPEPESVPDPIQTPKKIQIWCHPYLLLSTCPNRIPTSLSESVEVDPSVLGLEESAFGGVGTSPVPVVDQRRWLNLGCGWFLSPLPLPCKMKGSSKSKLLGSEEEEELLPEGSEGPVVEPELVVLGGKG